MIEVARTGAGVVEVVFSVPAACGARLASVVGDFNDWVEDATPMVADDDGGFTARVALQSGRTYRFRYLLDGVRWENDWAAHAYVPNDFGGNDSLIDLTAGPTSTRAGSEPAANGTDAPSKTRDKTHA